MKRSHRTEVYVDEIKKVLCECQANEDPESAHMEADAALCALLEHLGFMDVVVEYHKVNKWFA